MPIDPINTAAQYGYYYCSGFVPQADNCGHIFTGISTNYILATRFENPATISNSCPSGFGGWDNPSLNYIVGKSN
jgi:hypothetical protein